MRDLNHIVDEWVESHATGADPETVCRLAAEYQECLDDRSYYEFDGARVLWLEPQSIVVKRLSGQVEMMSARQFIDAE